MVCVSFAVLPKADKGLGGKLKDEPAILDHYVGAAGKTHYLLATTEDEAAFTGLSPLQMCFEERGKEDLIALISQANVNYSMPLFRLYADPLSNKSLVADDRLSSGFTFRAQGIFHTPEDSIRLLRALDSGSKITGVYRREGVSSAVADSRIIVMRAGDYHPPVAEALKAFKGGSDGGAKKLHVVAVTVKSGKISVDNTFKPKAITSSIR